MPKLSLGRLQIPFKQGSINAWPGKYSTNGSVYVDGAIVIIRIILPVGLFIASVLFTRFWYLVWWLRPSWLPQEGNAGEVSFTHSS